MINSGSLTANEHSRRGQQQTAKDQIEALHISDSSAEEKNKVDSWIIWKLWRTCWYRCCKVYFGKVHMETNLLEAQF